MLKHLLLSLLFMLGFAASISAQKPPVKVIVFLSSSCVMCQGYAHNLQTLHTQFASKQVEFLGVFPNYYTTDSMVNAFAKKYKISFPLVRDTTFYWTNKLAATVTPQVFVLSTDSILYSGMIDNGYYKPGKRRGTTSEFYLQNVLNQWTSNAPITQAPVSPIGCFIVKN